MNYSRIPCKEYWNPSNEEDKTLNLPNFIDTIGLDVQLSSPEKDGSVNSQMINLIINGTRKLRSPRFRKEIKKRNENEEHSGNGDAFYRHDCCCHFIER